ncbi:MAG: hypothetical protein IPP17_30260 [Bacteroidetes bacterium]|nr:hypothetical protein [Bacteroidota bacterium]
MVVDLLVPFRLGLLLSAWEIENKRIRKLESPASPGNEMVVFHFAQATAIAVIGLAFGWLVMLYFVAAAVSGFLLLKR